jgi:hypothetical protein
MKNMKVEKREKKYLFFQAFLSGQERHVITGQF